MGKTPKKAAPGGDERNLYNRRLKATTAPSNPSESSLHKRQRESEISNRSKIATLKKKIPSGPRKNFKSKICVPKKFELSHSTKHIGNLPESSKKRQLADLEKGEKSDSSEMQPESEEIVQSSPSVQKKDSDEDVLPNIQESNMKHVDHASDESGPIPKEQEQVVNKEVAVEEVQTEKQDKSSDINSSVEADEQEKDDLNLILEPEENFANEQEDKSEDKNLLEENNEKCPSAVKNSVSENEDLQGESQTDTESCSADVPEVTTSEVSEVSESASQNDTKKGKEKVEGSINKDISFVSYDPSITLKDVQIKLNDCLKENSKLFDTSNNSHNAPSQITKDVSFGRTIRNISGRRSLSRMRHVTLREQRYSPNNSMFVNTSSISMPPDDTEDYKILRYNTGLSDTFSSTNGSPTDRKRKQDSDDWSPIKKQKTESENSLLNSSISLLKGIRRPIQVSTPVTELKFQSSKLNLEEESKSATEATKKWCLIM